MEYSNEYVKHVFTEEEKREIAVEMAQKVSEVQQAEDDKKAVMSDFKSTIDGLQAKVNNAATKLNNGYEMRTIRCVVEADYTTKEWIYRNEETGEVVKTKAMRSEDLQLQVPATRLLQADMP